LRLRSRIRSIASAAQPARRRRQRGQGLAEFALIWPIFVVTVMGVIEFGVAFNNLLTVNYASRNSALLAAEAGNNGCADALVLNSIENDTTPPADRKHITQVVVYYSDRNGGQLPDGGNSGANTYVRNPAGSPLTCTFNAQVISVPYQLSGSLGYPTADRCNILAGCLNTGGHAALDTVGVRITYNYRFITPLSVAIALLQGSGNFNGGNWTFTQSNQMRMEPVL
jgi:Flp pilus assembly protein TadG